LSLREAIFSNEIKVQNALIFSFLFLHKRRSSFFHIYSIFHTALKIVEERKFEEGHPV